MLMFVEFQFVPVQRMFSSIAIVFLIIGISPSNADSSFLIQTRSTRLINRTVLGFPTECSIRIGEKDFTLKFYRLISCRYVRNLRQIYPYLLKYSNDITGLEITDSIIEHWNTSDYRKILRRFEFLIFHRTTLNRTESCPFNVFAKKLFYLHMTEFSPSLDSLVSHPSCSSMKRLHALILDHTPLGNEAILLRIFPHLHLLRLNFSSFIHPLNSSYMSSFLYLQDFFLKVSDNCHRCEYEWLKYAARDEKLILFRLSPQSGCMDWHAHERFLSWKEAPLCGSCSLPLVIAGRPITSQQCRIEDGITEYYCQAFYGRYSSFQPWTRRFEKKIPGMSAWTTTTRRPPNEFMKSKYTPSSIQRLKRDETVGSYRSISSRSGRYCWIFVRSLRQPLFRDYHVWW